MADFSSNFNISDLKGIEGALKGLKNAGQFKERDIEPLNTISHSMGQGFIRRVLEKAMDKVPSNIKKTVEADFQESIKAWGKSPSNLDTDDDYDSLITSKSDEFHTMTALGRKRTDLTKGVIKGLSSVPGGTTAMMQYLFLLDENDEITDANFLLSSPGKAFGNVKLETDLQIGDSGINGLYVVHYFTKEKGNYTKNYIGAQYWQNEEYPASDPTITAPVQRNNNNNYHNIVIGLARGATKGYAHADADYSYHSLAAGQAYIPFTGSIRFGSAIEDIRQPDNLRAKLYITTASGSVRDVTNNQWTNCLKVSSSDPAKLEWDFSGNNLANFGNIDWGVDHAAYLHFEVGVKTQNSKNKDNRREFVYAQIHSLDKEFVPDQLRITDSYLGTQDNVIDGIAYTYPVEHSWHCVASGTLVTMEDGSNKPIDDVVGGEILQIDATNTMEVRSTVEQPVMDTDTVYELIDSNGNTLVITGDHWIAQPDGYKPVAELCQSDEILTLSGTATIQSLKPIDFDGMLFSLSLGNHEERRTIGFEGTTFAANNILVGDNQLCRVQNLLRLKDHEYLTQKLPPEWKAVADAMQALTI